MEILLKYVILLYFFIIFVLFYSKPSLFHLSESNKKRKLIYLISLFIIIAIICFYLKIISFKKYMTLRAVGSNVLCKKERVKH